MIFKVPKVHDWVPHSEQVPHPLFLHHPSHLSTFHSHSVNLKQWLLPLALRPRHLRNALLHQGNLALHFFPRHQLLLA